MKKDILGTIDYVNEANGYCSFRTCPEEKNRLIFQIGMSKKIEVCFQICTNLIIFEIYEGTSNADRAVALAKMVQDDVSGIDVNMGCPKPYSTNFGMGAKLLLNQPNAKSILTSLVKHIPLPITCKIRILDNVENSIKLAKELESTGINAIAVHGRTASQKSSEPVNKGIALIESYSTATIE